MSALVVVTSTIEQATNYFGSKAATGQKTGLPGALLICLRGLLIFPAP